MTNLIKLILVFSIIVVVFTKGALYQSTPYILSGSTILQDFFLSTANDYYAVLQEDGNFVLYTSKFWRPSFAIWSSGTPYRGTQPYRLILQEDGNLVTYDSENKVIWATNTENKGTKPYRLVLQQDRNLVLYDANNVPIWATHTRKQ